MTNTKKKVLLFYTHLYPFGTGEAFVENEINYLSENFDEILILPLYDSPEMLKRQTPENVRIDISKNKKINLKTFCFFLNQILILFFLELPHLFNIKRIKTFVYCLRVTYRYFKSTNQIIKNELLSEENKDIYCYAYWGNEIALCAILNHKIYKTKKCIARFHRWDLYAYTNAANYLPFKKYIYQHLDKLVFIAQDGINYYKQNYLKNTQINESKFSLNYLGTSPHSALRSDYTLNHFRIVSCSGINSNKRVDLIATALSLIDDISIEWIHFGGATTTLIWKKFENTCKNLLSKKRNIKYTLKGNVKNNEVIEFYINNEVFLFINSSISEGLPVSIMEAMSFSIPVLANNAGGTKEIVENSFNGTLFKNITPELLSAELIRLSKLPIEEYSLYRINAYKTWNLKFNAEKNYQTFVENTLLIKPESALAVFY
ncbi:MAG: glycosyltransferase [Bacteroidota bacterium]